MLDFLERFAPGARARVLAGFPRASLEAFESSPRTSWLPIEHDHWVVDGICEVLGVERAIRCWRDSVSDLVDKPLLRTFVGGMLRVIGANPARRVGLLPKGWGLVYRDFCTLRLEDEGPTGVSLVFDDLAAELRTYPNYLHSFQGVCEGFAAVAEIPGTIAFRTSAGLRRMEAVFDFSPG
jgi:hypothetical protein